MIVSSPFSSKQLSQRSVGEMHSIKSLHTEKLICDVTQRLTKLIFHSTLSLSVTAVLFITYSRKQE